MKRAFLRKVKSVSCSPCATDAQVEQPEQTYRGVKRRARTSAAMIGLAFSMGTSSLLLPRQNDGAKAAESQPTEAATPSVQRVATLSSLTGAELAASTSAITVVEHVVGMGQTLQQIANSYRVDVEAITAANHLLPTSSLKVGQTLRIPVSNKMLGTAQLTGESAELTKADSVRSGQLVALAELSQLPSLGSSVSDMSPGSSLQVGRDNALSRLRLERDKLKGSLAELRSGESTGSAIGSSKDHLAIAPRASSEAKVASAQAASEISTGQSLNSTVNPVSEAVALNAPATSDGAAAMMPAAPAAPQMNVQPEVTIAAVSSTVYRVSPGDTVAQIARNHNIPLSLLVDTNHLSDPNIIFVGQELRVPPTQSASSAVNPKNSVRIAVEDAATSPTVVSSSNSSGNFGQTQFTSAPVASAAGLTQPSAGVSNPTVPAQTAYAAVESAPSSANAEVNAPLSNSGVNNSVQQVAAVRSLPASIAPEIPTQAEPENGPSSSSSVSRSTPYVENLLAEIRALRARHVHQIANRPVNVQRPSVVAAAPASAVSSAAGLGGDFPAPRGNDVSRAANPQDRSNMVATAPLGSENYAPLMQPITGRMVSPDLPALANPDAYLPNGPSKGFMWPAKGMLSSGFGWRWGRMHQGIDIASDVGTPIYAAATGVVEYSGWNSGGYGNMVEVRHADGSMTRYAHLNRSLVQAGQRVEQGQQIAEMGSTGYSTGPHLHFEVHPNGGPAVNPIAFLPAH